MKKEDFSKVIEESQKPTELGLNEYQQKALSFRLPTASHEYAILGLSGEVGELHQILAKSVRDGVAIDLSLLQKELGDILWFISAISADFGFKLHDVGVANLEKLSRRALHGTLTGSGDLR